MQEEERETLSLVDWSDKEKEIWISCLNDLNPILYQAR